MQTLHQSLSTTEMEVTSIRLERELKEKLKAISGHQGYQALIRDILWNYIETHNSDNKSQIIAGDIRATIPATAYKEQRCTLTGRTIEPQDEILLGLTLKGILVPLCMDCINLNSCGLETATC
jgi:metal-responsive CopG/Arc/MetJ family transcriptional regulator